MRDLADLRADIEVATAPHADDDALAAIARDGLRMAFDDIAPDTLKFSPPPGVELHVRLPRDLEAQRQAEVDHAFAAAVANIGREIAGDYEASPLTAADYRRARLYTRNSGNGLLLLVPDTAHGPLAADAASTAEASLARLVDLMPETQSDSRLGQNMRAARQPSVRALKLVADAVKVAGEMQMDLIQRGGARSQAVLTPEQAANIRDYASDEAENVTRRHLEGRLDGTRLSRRQFFLEYDFDRDGHAHSNIAGLVDEPLVALLPELIGQLVHADLEEVRRVRADGGVSRPSYRLTGIRPVDRLL